MQNRHEKRQGRGSENDTKGAGRNKHQAEHLGEKLGALS
jgi:hypothetical protein